MKEYVAGFLFSPSRTRVALIRKTKPDWQAGKLNGVGGKVELGESPLAAMIREFREEAGARVENWERFCTLGVGDSALVHFFRAFDAFDDVKIETQTDELVDWYNVGSLPFHPTLPNLSWLIPLALCEGSEAHVFEPSAA